jgi:hypothetical protein
MRLLAIIFLLFLHVTGYAQFTREFSAVKEHNHFPVSIDPLFTDTLTFNKNWDYLPKIYKKENRLFDANTETPAAPADTAHYYYTASINMNDNPVINYVLANNRGDSTALLFGPLDEKDFSLVKLCLTIKDNQFRVDSVYMPLRYKYRQSFQVTAAALTMKKLPQAGGQEIYGYMDIIIKRKIVIATETRERDYHIKGYFKVPLIQDQPRFL